MLIRLMLQCNLNRSPSASVINLQQKNICLEGCHLVLVLLVVLVHSTKEKLFLRKESEIMFCIYEVLKQNG